tara:strand:- start:159 stop:533 length:375 start_codon:yes stop_codon:yes gene_type:complete
MKKLLTAITLLTAVSTSAIADSATVFNYDTGKKETITRSQINENDIKCIGILGAWRDALFNQGAQYNTSLDLEKATDSQNKMLLKYPFTVPTKWIDGEKELFLIRASDSKDEWIHSQIKSCYIN